MAIWREVSGEGVRQLAVDELVALPRGRRGVEAADGFCGPPSWTSNWQVRDVTHESRSAYTQRVRSPTPRKAHATLWPYHRRSL
jgi:hypothetical protein